MNTRMEMPKYYELIRVVAIIGAVLGCLGGAVSIVTGFIQMFRSGGIAVGFPIMGGGVAVIIGALVSLGIINCFLAMVEAQVDTRNVIVEYTSTRRGGFEGGAGSPHVGSGASAGMGQSEGGRFCKQCGAKCESGMQFCSECGGRLG